MIQTLLELCPANVSASVTQAQPEAVGLSDARAAAAALCPVVAVHSSQEAQLASTLQDVVAGSVLTCSNRSAFLEAITMFQPSGYPPLPVVASFFSSVCIPISLHAASNPCTVFISEYTVKTVCQLQYIQ